MTLRQQHDEFTRLMTRVRQCTVCQSELPQPPRPVLAASPDSRIIVIGQAPGIVAHDTAMPWNDRSGDRLRNWMGVDRETFYNTDLISLIPMGFCFPGYKNGADAPPRKECAPTWHHLLMENIQPDLVLLVGRYAQQYYCKEYRTLTLGVEKEAQKDSKFMILPHPSGRNNRWLRNNGWFEASVVPQLKARVADLLSS